MKTGKLILIVEDDFDIRQGLKLVLESEDYGTLEAENGQVALDLLLKLDKTEWPDCILLDLQMPIMTGKEFLSKIVSDYPETLAKIPIVINSAKGNSGDDFKLLPLKLEMLRKPLDIEVLLQVIGRHCGKPV